MYRFRELVQKITMPFECQTLNFTDPPTLLDPRIIQQLQCKYLLRMQRVLHCSFCEYTDILIYISENYFNL